MGPTPSTACQPADLHHIICDVLPIVYLVGPYKVYRATCTNKNKISIYIIGLIGPNECVGPYVAHSPPCQYISVLYYYTSTSYTSSTLEYLVPVQEATGMQCSQRMYGYYVIRSQLVPGTVADCASTSLGLFLGYIGPIIRFPWMGHPA